MGTPHGRRTDVAGLLAIVGLAALIMLANAAVTPGAGWGAEGAVRVDVSVRSGMAIGVDDGRLTVRSNIPWEASARLPDGRWWAISGGPTSGHSVELPEGSTEIQVYAL